jgi:hypothetical protein
MAIGAHDVTLPDLGSEPRPRPSSNHGAYIPGFILFFPMVEIHHKRRVSPSAIRTGDVLQLCDAPPFLFYFTAIAVKIKLPILLIPPLLRSPLLRYIAPGPFPFAPAPTEKM